jgi:hypothetical protein
VSKTSISRTLDSYSRAREILLATLGALRELLFATLGALLLKALVSPGSSGTREWTLVTS